MKNSCIALALCFLPVFALVAQTNQDSLNFGFEKLENNFPKGVSTFGNEGFSVSIDSNTVHSGKYSLTIKSEDNVSGFKAISFNIPTSYQGKKIKLSGYLKTENVENYAGLWLRIDPAIGFDNMQNRKINGSRDWTKFETELTMNPERTTGYVYGALLAGKGQIWVDDLMLTIDGKKFDKWKLFERELYKADLDTAFNNGSGISIPEASDKTIEKLKLLGQVWGFLKYYHPNIAKGDYNWDYELFRVLPKVLNSTNEDELHEVLNEWVSELGSFKVGKELELSDITKYNMQPDLAWIDNSNLTASLQETLKAVKNAKREKNHYYFELTPVGNPQFNHENMYQKMNYSDDGYCLLSLFRYWNVIQYLSPYKYTIGEDWNAVLEEFIPKFLKVKTELEYGFAVKELIVRTHDSHADIYGHDLVLRMFKAKRYAPVEVTFIEKKAVVTAFYDNEKGIETGLEVGDEIIEINRKLVSEIVKDYLPVMSGSNYPTQLRNISGYLLRSNDSTISIKYIHDGEKNNGVISTFLTSDLNISNRFYTADTCFKMLNENIAYINNSSLKRKYLPALWEGFKDTKGLILDLRNYPTDFPIYELSKYLMDSKKPFVKFTNGSIQTPGLFEYTSPLFVGKKNNDDYYKGKVIILVNEITQSSAEFHAMAYKQAPNAIIIGSTTAGADGNVSHFYLPGAIKTAITGIGVYYPEGEETQRIGIVPDIFIEPTVIGIQQGKDEVLEKAIELIEEQK